MQTYVAIILILLLVFTISTVVYRLGTKYLGGQSDIIITNARISQYTANTGKVTIFSFHNNCPAPAFLDKIIVAILYSNGTVQTYHLDKTGLYFEYIGYQNITINGNTTQVEAFTLKAELDEQFCPPGYNEMDHVLRITSSTNTSLSVPEGELYYIMFQGTYTDGGELTVKVSMDTVYKMGEVKLP